MKFRIITILFILSIILYAGPGQDEFQKEIDVIKQKLNSLNQRQKEYKKKEQQAIDEINDFDEKIFLTNKLKLELEKEENQASRRISFLDKEISIAEHEIAQMKQELAKTLRLIYMYEEPAAINVLFNTSSAGQFMKLYYFNNILMDKKQFSISDLESGREKKVTMQSELIIQKDNLVTLIEEKDSIIGDLEKEKKEKDKFLNRIKKEKSKLRKEGEKLRQSLEEIEKKISALIEEEAKKKIVEKKTDFEIEDQFIWPVTGKIIRKFGKIKHPVYKTYINNKGIGIKAKEGSQVSASLSGNVMFADWIRGRGLTIIIEHSNNLHTVYGNIIETFVKTGDFVSQSDIIGKVGKFGNTKESFLYFEIRENNKVINPEKRLK